MSIPLSAFHGAVDSLSSGMLTATLTRAVEFPAGHRYYRPEWTAARNDEVFGKCARPPAHGHNYRVEATVLGDIDPETGMIVDLVSLDAALAEAILEPMDHAFLNDLPEFSGGLVPTTENLARVAWDRLLPLVPASCSLVSVRVYEDRNLWSEVRAPGG
jgi:6-pyruvoyltetrahydropterin/6-carboxytetrahydropterin synthase